MKTYVVCSSLVLLFFTSCKKEEIDTSVHYSGALKTMMSGNLDATISLDSLSRKQNLYALGAIENLKGEIQIFNSEPLISEVINETIEIDFSFKKNASLLVWAQVNDWGQINIPSTVQTINQLEEFIMKRAKENGVNIEKPFPFLIEGKAENLSWHVIDWVDGDTIHSHQKHKEAGKNGLLENEVVKILGFYSEAHKAIFTHHSTFIHMHFKNDNESIAGHVDELKLGKLMVLKLPKQ